MNLITHIMLNIALGEVLSLNLTWVILGGLIPDLDYLLGLTHRTITHSLVFIILLSYLIHRGNKRHGVSLFIGLLTHLVLDVATTQGVMLLYPFRTSYSFHLFNSSTPSINLLIIVLSMIALYNKNLLNYKLSKLDYKKIQFTTYSFLIIPLIISIPFTHYEESKCAGMDLTHLLTHVSEFDEECVVVNGVVCSEVEEYTSSSSNEYEIFDLCNTGMSVKVWLLKTLSPGLNKGENVTITGLFTTKYFESSGYEIYMIKDVKKN